MEGYWLNSKTGKYFEIHEHAQWLLDLKNFKKIGLPAELFQKIKSKDFDKDRLEILFAAMNAGLIRIRSHGNYIAFEFTIKSKDAIESIHEFLLAEELAGPYSDLTINNLRTGETIMLKYNEFLEMMEEDIRKILRRAKKSKNSYSDGIIKRFFKI